MSNKDIYQQLREITVYLEYGDRMTLETVLLEPLSYNALLLLDAESGLRMGDLRDRLLCDKSRMTRVVDRLEQFGLAERVEDPQDRRAIRVMITPKGEAQLARAREVHDASLERRFGVLSRREQDQLEQLLNKLTDSLAQQYAAAVP